MARGKRARLDVDWTTSFSGEDIKLLRSMVFGRQADFAARLFMRVATVSGWEREQTKAKDTYSQIVLTMLWELMVVRDKHGRARYTAHRVQREMERATCAGDLLVRLIGMLHDWDLKQDSLEVPT
ncbi:MAG: hypothetical protein ABIL09_12985 [Gemmatimonadota bacterium]